MPFSRPGVVIDNGNFAIKAGFTCDNHPLSIIRTVVGRPKNLEGTYGKKYYDVYLGDDAIQRLDTLDLSYPVSHGEVVHWENMERIWHCIFYKELRVAPEERAVVLCMPAMVTMKEKIKTCIIFFEVLNAPAICVQNQAVLAMYGSGFTTGICVDLGHEATSVTPVYEGGILQFANNKIFELSGIGAERLIANSLRTRGYEYETLQNAKILEDIKRKYIFVTNCCSIPRYPRITNMYKMPNGKEIDVTDEGFHCGEMFFQPDEIIGDKGVMSLPKAVVNSVLKCDADLQNDMYSAIVLGGGMSMFPGMAKRLNNEIESMVDRPVNVVGSDEGSTLSWMGGALFAGIPDAQKVCVTKKEYEEQGERVIKNRFL